MSFVKKWFNRIGHKLIRLSGEEEAPLPLEKFQNAPDLFHQYRAFLRQPELTRKPGGWEYKGRFYQDYLTVGGAGHAIFRIALRYCQGTGIEVGAGLWPLPGAVPADEGEQDGHKGDDVEGVEHAPSLLRRAYFPVDKVNTLLPILPIYHMVEDNSVYAHQRRIVHVEPPSEPGESIPRRQLRHRIGSAYAEYPAGEEYPRWHAGSGQRVEWNIHHRSPRKHFRGLHLHLQQLICPRSYRVHERHRILVTRRAVRSVKRMV